MENRISNMVIESTVELIKQAKLVIVVGVLVKKIEKHIKI